MINNFKTGEIRGFWRFGTWLHFLIFENIIYIFLRVSLLNVFVYFISFKKILLCGVLHRDKQMKDILREAVVEKSRSCSFLLSLLKVHVIASVCVRACVRVSVCAHTSRCNMELLSSAKERFDCLFFLWYWKKKQNVCPAPFGFICSSPPWLSPIPHFVLINLCTSGTNR